VKGIHPVVVVDDIFALTYRQQWSDPAVAVSAGAADGPIVQ